MLATYSFDLLSATTHQQMSSSRCRKAENFGKEKLKIEKILSIKLYFWQIAKTQQLFQFSDGTYPFYRDWESPNYFPNFTLQIFLYHKDQDLSINRYYVNERAQIHIGSGMRTAKGNHLAAYTPYFLLLNRNGLFNSFAFSYM